jgi:hypothetical protein
MKSLILVAATASAFAMPLAAFAQSESTPTPTRAQVQAELRQLEQAGYRPGGEESAEARVSTGSSLSGDGGVTSGLAATGRSQQ